MWGTPFQRAPAGVLLSGASQFAGDSDFQEKEWPRDGIHKGCGGLHFRGLQRVCCSQGPASLQVTLIFKNLDAHRVTRGVI